MSDLVIEFNSNNDSAQKFVKNEIKDQIEFVVFESKKFDGDLFHAVTTVLIPLTAAIIPFILSRFFDKKDEDSLKKTVKIKIRTSEIHCKNITTDELKEILETIRGMADKDDD